MSELPSAAGTLTMNCPTMNWQSGTSLHRQAEIDDESIQAVTGICLTAADDAEIVHLMFVGTDDDIRLTPDELFEHIDAIEAYRVGDPRPEFN